MVEATAKFREQLDSVKLAFIQLLLGHFATQLFSETVNEVT